MVVSVYLGLAVVTAGGHAHLLLFFSARVIEGEPCEDRVGKAAVAAVLDSLEGRSIGIAHAVDGCRRDWRSPVSALMLPALASSPRMIFTEVKSWR